MGASAGTKRSATALRRWITALVALASAACHGYYPATMPGPPGGTLRAKTGTIRLLLKDGREFVLDSLRVQGDSAVAFGYSQRIAVHKSDVASVRTYGIQGDLTLLAVIGVVAAVASAGWLVQSCAAGI